MKPNYILLGLLAVLTLAACGGGVPQAGNAGAGQTPTAGSAQMRTVRHAMGETQVPAVPRSVVVLDTGELDSAIALGVKPVGAVEALPGAQFLSYIADKTEGVENVGTIEEPNLEKIAALRPDLILSSKVRHEDIYPQLSVIAPTVFTETVGVVWKENFMRHAEALGKSDLARELMAEYDRRTAEFRQKNKVPEDFEVSVVRFLADQVRLYQKGSFVGTVLEDAGLARPPSQRNPDETWLEANKERIDDLDGDVMFLTHYGPAEKTPLQQFRDDQLWSRLDVVKQGKVYEVPDDYWMLGIGIGAANKVLDDLEKYVIEGRE